MGREVQTHRGKKTDTKGKRASQKRNLSFLSKEKYMCSMNEDIHKVMNIH